MIVNYGMATTITTPNTNYTTTTTTTTATAAVAATMSSWHFTRKVHSNATAAAHSEPD